MKRTIAVFLPNWIGDVVMATPTLRAIRKQFGDSAEIIGIMRPYVRAVLDGSAFLDRVIELDPRSENLQLRSWQVVRQLRAARVSDALILTNSLRPALISWVARVPHRIGYARYGRQMLLSGDGRFTPARDARRKLLPISAVDYYLQLTKALGVADSLRANRQPELATTDDEQAGAQSVWDQFGWSNDEIVVSLNTGGAYGAAKSWPNQHFAQLAIRLVQQYRAKVLMLCGPAEQASAGEVVDLARHPHVVSLASRSLSIGLTKACVQRSRLLVSTDSGPRHFAAAFGVPCVSIYGPTDPQWSHNYGIASRDAQIELACRPCAKRTCPLGHHDCMNQLTPHFVLQLIAEVLEKGVAHRAA